MSNSLFYDKVRFKIEVGVEEKFICKNVTKQTQHVHCDSSNTAALRGGHILDLDLTVNMLWLCDPSNLLLEYSFYPPRSDVLFSNYFEDLLRYADRVHSGQRNAVCLTVCPVLAVQVPKLTHQMQHNMQPVCTTSDTLV